MTPDDILRMAREVGLRTGDNQPGRYRSAGVNVGVTESDLLAFADLVAAAERESRQAAQRQVADLQERIARADVELQRAVLAEREECAKACEAIEADRWALYKGRPPYTGKELGRANQITQGESDGAGLCADAIRARGKT